MSIKIKTDVDQIINDLIRSLHDFTKNESPSVKTHRPVIMRPRSIDDWLKSPISQKHEITRFFLWFEKRLDVFFSELTESPTFRAAIIQCPGLLNTPIAFLPLEDDWDAGAIYDTNADYILVNYQATPDDYYHYEPDHMKLSYIIHEYRHAFHHLHNKIRPRVHTTDVYSILSQNFVQEAEVNAFQATVCMELYQRGYKKYWKAYCQHSSQLARALMDTLSQNPQALENGKAQTAVFYAWFKDQGKIDFYADTLIKGFKKNRMKIQLPDHESERNEELQKTNHNEKNDVAANETAMNENVSKTIMPYFVAANPKYNMASNPEGLMPFINDNEIIKRPDYMANLDLPASPEYYTRHVAGSKIEALKMEIYKSIVRKENMARAASSPTAPYC